ncbi:membrane protein S5 [Saimiriine betaherpesvirus 4]|uniref:Membrane protein S5 n=1 Tax=Saimiriine betaherpesvirus 4 TaxID=1535247 RepID=G8XSS3_9BETA|nr:membrane protein S5 [Saimiriine betaherpesvirus 4]AEV80870.1 membrane protein S5 [Saimiriine betaherpesvirus 4]
MTLRTSIFFVLSIVATSHRIEKQVCQPRSYVPEAYLQKQMSTCARFHGQQTLAPSEYRRYCDQIRLQNGRLPFDFDIALLLRISTLSSTEHRQVSEYCRHICLHRGRCQITHISSQCILRRKLYVNVDIYGDFSRGLSLISAYTLIHNTHLSLTNQLSLDKISNSHYRIRSTVPDWHLEMKTLRFKFNTFHDTHHICNVTTDVSLSRYTLLTYTDLLRLLMEQRYGALAYAAIQIFLRILLITYLLSVMLDYVVKEESYNKALVMTAYIVTIIMLCALYLPFYKKIIREY